MSEIHRPLDPWQADTVETAFAMDANLWAAFELLILLSRQNGKGGSTEAIELGSLFLFKEKLILHSAHQFKTSTAAFRRLVEIIDASDWLTRRVQFISRSKGDESILLTPKAGGGRLQFVARSLGSGRGLTGSKTVFDEAWALTVGQYAAQTPTLATIPNPQIIYTTTPPDDDIGPVPDDAMLPSVRKRAMHRGLRTALYEWSPPEGFDRTDPQVWYDCNPALGIRISEWFLASQLLAYTEAGKPEKFDTEHLGLWPEDGGVTLISLAIWAKWLDVDSAATGRVCFALDAAPDSSMAAIGMTGRRPDGLRHWQLLKHAAGTSWLLDEAKSLNSIPNCGWAVDPTSPAGALIPDMLNAGLTVHKVSGQDLQQACTAITNAAKDGGGRHIGQKELDQAWRDARTVRSGDSQRFGRRRSSGDITPLMVVTLSDHGFRVHGEKKALEPFALFG
jgi:phage terminase large subunit-like protein